MNKKKIINICLILLTSTSLLYGCDKTNKGTQDNKDAVQESVVNNVRDVDEKYKTLNEWQGTWTSFSSLCDEEDLSNTWDYISDNVSIDTDKLTSTFKNLCFISDDISKFEIKDNEITAYNTEGDKVFSKEYELISMYDKDSDETVVEGGESYLFKAKDGESAYKYICLMPICDLESNDQGVKMASHFHFNYGNTIEKATDSSGIPTMVESNIDLNEKKETLLAFFCGSK